MSIKITANTRNRLTVTTAPKNRITLNTRLGVGGNAIDTVAELRDVDATDVDNNETLVFDSTLQKYVVKVLPLIDGGSY